MLVLLSPCCPNPCCCHPFIIPAGHWSSLPIVGSPCPSLVVPAHRWWSLPVVCPPAHHSSSLSIVHHPCPLSIIPAFVMLLSNVLAPMLHPTSSGSQSWRWGLVVVISGHHGSISHLVSRGLQQWEMASLHHKEYRT